MPRGSSKQPIRHGTNGGYQQHRRRGEDPCDKCKVAKSNYQQEFRNDPARKAAESKRNAAQWRAFKRLRQLYPREYRTLYLQELKK